MGLALRDDDVQTYFPPVIISDTGTVVARLFLQWCQESGFGGWQMYPVIAWEYHEYLLANEAAQVSANVFARQLGMLCPKKMKRVRRGDDLNRLRRVRRLLIYNGWPKSSADDAAEPKVCWYQLPAVSMS